MIACISQTYSGYSALALWDHTGIMYIMTYGELVLEVELFGESITQPPTTLDGSIFVLLTFFHRIEQYVTNK